MFYLVKMDFHDINDESEFRQKYDGLPDFHLRNPLRSFPHHIIEIKNKSTDKRVKSSLEALRGVRKTLKGGRSHDLWTDAHSYLVDDTLGEIGISLQDTIERLSLDSYLSHYFAVDTMQDLIMSSSDRLESKYMINMNNFQIFVVIINALSSRRPIPEKYKEHQRSGVVHFSTISGNQVLLTPSFLGLIKYEYPTEIILYPSDWVRCSSDVHTERFLLNLTANIGNELNREHYPPWSVISKILTWGDQVLIRYGNPGFKLIKTYEALCIGYLLKSGDDKIVDNSAFWMNTIRDLVAEDDRWCLDLAELTDILHSLDSIHWFSQVYGLHRIWGHPEVNSDDGMTKVIKIGRKDITLSDKTPKEAGNHFKKMFMSEFLKRNRRYPNLYYSGSDKEVVSMIDTNNPNLVDLQKGYDNVFEEITLSKNFQIPETFNLSMIVADKSVSPTVSELKRNIKSRKSVMNSELRRGVLRWLNDDSVDPREFLIKVSEGKFPEDHKIIGLTPKERELNPTPRMFALMSHLMRVYVVITESMLSEHVLPMFPQITMIDSLLDLNKKIIGNSKKQLSNFKDGRRVGKKTICMSLDFEKWNGHMRKSSTYYVFEELGNLFGMGNLYNATYDIFEQSYIYLADGSYVPSIDHEGELEVSEPRSFKGHKGGMEGLRQKGWTLFTIVCLDMICKRHNCIYNSMGMGDNQILMLTYYTYKVNLDGSIKESGIQEIKEKHKRLFDDLIDVFGELGLPLKPLETWASECLFLYGKFPVWKGMPLSMDMKKLMRVFSFSNMDIMTIENMLNTVAGAAAAATQSSPCVLVSYLVGIFMLCFTARQILHYHPLMGKSVIVKTYQYDYAMRKGKNIDARMWKVAISGRLRSFGLNNQQVGISDLVLLMITVPRSLGGYVTYNLPSIMIRGFPDPLSRDLYSIMGMIRSSLNLRISAYLENWSRVIFMPEINYKMMMEDILSVNHLNPITPMSHIRQTVAQFLSSHRKVKNKEFVDLMAVSKDPNKELLSNMLCSGRKLHIRLLHDIYESTIIGYVDGIISKVTKTSTIANLAVRHAQKDINDAISNTEINYFHFFNWRSFHFGQPWETDCPTRYAKHVREFGWKRELKGVTVPFPLSYMDRTACYSNLGSTCKCNDGYVSVHLSDDVNYNEWNASIGKSLPYMGSMTKEKVLVQSGIKIYSSEPLIKRPLRLMRAINWFVPEESETAKVIEKCVQSVTNISTEQFKGVEEGTSGAEIHRYNDSSLSHGTLTSSNYLYSTRYHMSTDNLFKYSKGGENYDVHFQSMLCLISEFINIEVFQITSGFRSTRLPRVIHWKETCNRCTSVVDDSFSDIKFCGSWRYIPSKPQNRYLYVEEDRLSYNKEIRPFLSMMNRYMTEGEYNRMSDVTKYCWMIDSISDKIVSQISTTQDAGELDDQVDLHGGDIFNRVAYLKVDPHDLFEEVSNKLIYIAMGSILVKGDFILPNAEALKERCQTMISDCPVGNFIGLGLLYSWAETRQMMDLDANWEPDDDPPSLRGACEASRRVLYSYISNIPAALRPRKTFNLVDEMKDIGLCYKLIACQKLMSYEGYCSYCMIELMSAPVREYTEQILHAICKRGHHVLERYRLKVNLSYVSMDRLRKDCMAHVRSIKEVTKKMNRQINLKYDHLITLFRTTEHRPKFYRVSDNALRIASDARLRFDSESMLYSETDIMKVITKPTSALYKYSEIFNHLRLKEFKSDILLLGDGSGWTSSLLRENIHHNSTIYVSTLISSESVMPQTMPHLFDHTMNLSNIDKTSMVNKVNNILDDRWGEDWEPIASVCGILISDIELIGENRYQDRELMFRKLLSVTSWKIACIKDYVYNYRELSRRVDIIVRGSVSFELLTSVHRQRKLPEVWWVIKNSTLIDMGFDDNETCLNFVPEIMTSFWSNTMSGLCKRNAIEWPLTLEIDDHLLNKSMYDSMIQRARIYCTVPTVGCLIPHQNNFTRVLGKLQSGFRPAKVSFSRWERSVKLYKSNEIKLTEILIIIAASMISNVKTRVDFINNARFMMVKWSGKPNTNTWMPRLEMNTERNPGFEVNIDYIGVLNRFFNKQQLCFREVSFPIKFAYSKKRGTLCYPVAKNMVIRLPK
ncbi:RNA-dependent RNA polymerase [Wuhan Insect virus 4]|uniref:Replicase n=1 Tax=Wuhan Insect virus 4 TaxID=1608109 RepID=A0A0B5KF21_9RHAB|nr:RNA-dependent RNA polymerase [Wuhan Insect virus 4]AJG39179.1 RNA-dependent RNA polymerase [Wuhan Insect virus 4]